MEMMAFCFGDILALWECVGGVTVVGVTHCVVVRWNWSTSQRSAIRERTSISGR